MSKNNIEKQDQGQIKIPETSPENRTSGVEIAPNLNVGDPAASSNDDKKRKIQAIKKSIEETNSNEKPEKNSDGNVPEIKTAEDLLAIEGAERKLRALLELADKGEKEKEKALKIAEENWGNSENAYLLDKLRDKLAE